MLSYEVVWTYKGQDYLMRRCISKGAALREFKEGTSRITKLIHGGTLRIDEVLEAR